MNPKPILSVEEEDGLTFNVIKVNLDKDDPFYVRDFVLPGHCKVIVTIDNMSRTYYFSGGVETSKERILQDERIKSLRR